jgi:Flp pilus assembly protein TadG
MKSKIMSNEKGAFLVIFALVLMVLLGFVALGIEGGRWFLVRAELSKSVDAGALAGANNVATPFAVQLAQDFAKENYQAGYVGTPGSGSAGSVQFTASVVGTNQVSVTGKVNATPVLAQLFGVTTIPVSANGVAQKNKVEIMMVLDRSGSMGQPISKMNALKDAAVGNCNDPQNAGFICYFKDTEADDKIGLVSFATTARVDFDLKNYFFAPISTAVTAMSPLGATNTAEALYLAGGPQGLPNQTGIPLNQRVQQFVIFFTDGRPTAFQGSFRYQGNSFSAVATVPGYCPIPPDTSYPNSWDQLADITTEGKYFTAPPHPYPAGDGSMTKTCSSSLQNNNLYLTTMWNRFTTVPPTMPYTPGQCVSDSVLGKYVCTQARQMSFDNAQVLKNQNIKIYAIGLGTSTDVDMDFLKRLSSDCDDWQNSWPACKTSNSFTYRAPTPAQLQAIFSTIAKDIKLRLVQ